MLALFSILALGCLLGTLTVRGISLGTAGVLFVALLFGHFGVTVPHEITELGLLLFVYAVGLQAGPRFFRTFRRRGVQLVAACLAVSATGALAAFAAAWFLGLPLDLAAGLYAGALTCTPALAAATDVVQRAGGSAATVSVGYGVAYPFSMLGMVVLMQLMPRLLRRDLGAEATRWREEQLAEQPDLEVRQFILRNPSCAGQRVGDIDPHRISTSNISRVRRGNRVFAATPELVLESGDVIMVVGSGEELDKMRLLLGEETQVPMDLNTRITSLDVEVSDDALAGRSLAELKVMERFHLVITRVRRQGLEIAPTGSLALEMGDVVRVVGESDAVEAFSRAVKDERRRDETNMVPFLAGLALGAALGMMPISLGGGVTLRLGIAGGAFLVALLMGHFRRVGRIPLFVPQAARYLARELGLMLFLAGAGTAAGAALWPVLQQQGWSLFLGGAFITVAAVLAGLLVVLRMSTLSAMGVLCASMTNPPALAAASSQTDCDLPTLSYASAYPVALIFKILLAQVLAGL